MKTLALDPREQQMLIEQVEGLMETWVTVGEVNETIRSVVQSHGYVPGSIKQEEAGKASWVVETDRGPVKVDISGGGPKS